MQYSSLYTQAFFVSTHYYLRRDLARQRERQQASRELDADYRERRQARDKAALLAQHKPSFGPPPKSALRKSGRAGSSYAATGKQRICVHSPCPH